MIDSETGELLPAHLFVSAIGTSGYPYVEAFPTESLESWITAHVNAFRYYGGVPHLLIPDNLKTGVKEIVETQTFKIDKPGKYKVVTSSIFNIIDPSKKTHFKNMLLKQKK